MITPGTTFYQKLVNREYRQYNFKSSSITNEWYRSQRSIHTLGFDTDLVGHNGCVNTINFSKGGDLLVSGSDDKEIRIWNVETKKCLEVLRGHISNVFAADFLPYRSNKEIISGSNDADIRHYDLEKKVCTVYSHHNKKVLRISVNPQQPDSFLSCSADGTIRMIDVRKKYSKTTSHTFDMYEDVELDDYVLPQAIGGGRASAHRGGNRESGDSIILDYCRRQRRVDTLYSVDMHPYDGYSFIVGSSLGNVMLFDLRKIDDKNPQKSKLSTFYNDELQYPYAHDITGCVFSKDGKEIVATALGDFIYVFDVNKNSTKKFGFESSTPNTKKRKNSNPELEKAKKTKTTSSPPSEEKIEEPVEMDVDDMECLSDSQSSVIEESIERPKSYKNVYMGHYSKKTIKGVNFYGPNSEYVITGSDDKRIFIWDKETTELLTVLEGHKGIVNCIVGHPNEPLIASSGIDDIVKLWKNVLDGPTVDFLKQRKERLEQISERNIRKYQDNQHLEVQTICTQQ